MTDEQFIDYCYRTILGRAPDQGGKEHYLSVLRKGGTRESILYRFLDSEEAAARVTTEFVPPGHFYSALPSREERAKFCASPAAVRPVAGIHLNEDDQVRFLETIKDYYPEMPFQATKTAGLRYYFDNPSYSYADAITLYSMMRHYRPARIVEIGCGYSSCVMLDTNELFFRDHIEMTFIEPYPELLLSLMKEGDQERVRIVPAKAQEVDLSLFAQLRENDILFIDSTHVSKLNSDVNRILFEILPSLHAGVLIHLHDIFWPFEYPAEWVAEGRAWNEAYILRAFLQYNTAFHILFFSSYVFEKRYDWVKDHLPLLTKNLGGHIWLRKK